MKFRNKSNRIRDGMDYQRRTLKKKLDKLNAKIRDKAFDVNILDMHHSSLTQSAFLEKGKLIQDRDLLKSEISKLDKKIVSLEQRCKREVERKLDSDTSNEVNDKEVPKLAEKLLYLTLSKKDREAAPGDLEEEYRSTIVPRHGETYAKIWYWSQVIRSIPWRALKDIIKLRVS